MARKKVSLDKDAILEFSAKFKDQIFLVVLLAALGAGGWYVYGQTSLTVDQIINQAKSGPGAGGGAAQSSVVDPQELVTLLTTKRPKSMYQVERNPFGSPEEQLRMRQEVDRAYQRGVELYNQGRYQESVDQFDRVIQLDVTETRMSYPVLPSEYKRRAMQENAKKNLDSILTSAQNDVNEGDRLAQAGQTDKAMELYHRARTNLASVIESDTDGKVIGADNLTKVKTLEQQAFKKFIQLRGQTLLKDVQAAMTEAQQASSGSDYIAMLKAAATLQRIQVEIQNIDPNAELVNRTTRTQVKSLYDQLESKVTSNFSALIAQAQQQFAQGITAKDLVKTQEAITALQQARTANPKDTTLAQQITDFIKQRADLVIQNAQQFVADQDALLKQGNYDQFDVAGRDRLLAELNRLADMGNTFDDAKRNQMVSAISSLKGLKLPPLLTSKYDIQTVAPMGSSYKVDLIDKTGPTARQRTLILREGRPDTSTRIELKKVDTDGGFVILSRPDYMDVKVPISSGS
ncbi:MAG: hypothetical protein GC154_09670 [bacterium]|nr:hypothetical protein [bacterium]